MANTDGEGGGGGGGGGETNMGYSHDEPRRKVSINQDAINADTERQRKISAASNSSSNRKSILVNGDRQHYTGTTANASRFLCPSSLLPLAVIASYTT